MAEAATKGDAWSQRSLASNVATNGVSVPNAYAASLVKLSLDAETLEKWEQALEHLLREAELGQFSSKLQLDTRVGRIIYSAKVSNKDNSIKTVLLDVPTMIVSSPINQSMEVRLRRLKLAAFSAQWAAKDVLLDVPFRVCLERSVTESKMLNALLDTAMAVHMDWTSWRPQDFPPGGASTAVYLFYAVMTVYYICMRECLVDLSFLASYPRIDQARKDLVHSLLLILFLSSPSNTSASASLNWIFASSEERELLHNAAGSCLDILVQSFGRRDDQSLDRALVNDKAFPVLLSNLLNEHKNMDAFAPVLPLAASIGASHGTTNRIQFAYPWPDSILSHLAKSAVVSDFFKNSAQFQAMRSLSELLVPIQDFESSLSARLAKASCVKLMATLREAINDRSSAASQALQKKRRATKEMMNREGQKKVKEATGTEPVTYKMVRERVTEGDLRHIKASDALVKMAWTSGAPWLCAFSSAIRPDQLTLVREFSVGGPSVPNHISAALMNVSKTPVEAASEQSMFANPEPRMMSIAAGAAARSSLLVQLKLKKPNRQTNCEEVSKTLTFTFAAALKAQLNAGVPSARKRGNISFSTELQQTAQCPITEESDGESDTAVYIPRALIDFCEGSGFKRSLSWSHVAIARAIASGKL